jgi:hypothetical protein
MEDPEALGAAVLGMQLIIFAIAHVYMAVCLMFIAKKTNTENGWLAWIPIANIVLMCQIAKKPVWWVVLGLIPCVNLVIFIILWMGIAQARGKPSWYGLLMLIPGVNLIIPAYLAFSS